MINARIRLSRFPQQGFTMIEILVALALGLLISAGIVQIYAGTKASYRLQDGLSRMQENARFALNQIAKDLRMTNFVGCAQKNSGPGSYKNSLKPINDADATNDFLWDFKKGLKGFEAMSAVDAQVRDSDSGVVSGSDVISMKVIRGIGATLTANLASDSETTLTANIPTSAQLKAAAGALDGDSVILTDCVTTSVFQIIGVDAVNGFIDVDTTQSSSQPGNVTFLDGSTRKVKIGQFKTGAKLYPVDTVTYYLKQSVSGNGAALIRRVNDGESGTGNRIAGSTDEIVDGVENMQITYGLDDTVSGSTLPERPTKYVDASAVTDWSKVLSVRIGLLMRSPDEADAVVDKQTYDVNGTTIDPTDDRRLRRVFTTTVALRNRAS